MSNNKLFKIPFGFYVENNQLISKRTQIEELLANINANADSNAQLDEKQQKEIDANKEAINQEIDRSTNTDEQFVKDLETEISERKRMGSILNDKIDNIDESLKSLVEETDKAFDVVAEELKHKDEMLDKKDEELSNSISFLRSNLDNETAERKNADENLSDAIKLNLEQIDGVDAKVSNLSLQLEESVKEIDERISINKGEISRIDGSLTAEMSNRIDGDKELLEKTNKLALSIREVYNYSKVKDEELVNAINAETARAIAEENKKIGFTDLGNGRKAIVMENHDLILGKDTKGGTYNIAMISKWDNVDLGTSSLPINLNTPSGVRPTVQEAGQSGEQAHKIAYLSDFDEAKAEMESLVKIEENRAISAEEALSNKLDSSVISLNSSINNVNSTLGILSSTDTALNSRVDLMTTSFNQFKESGIELVPTSELQYTLYVDGVNRGIIDIPKDNFLTNVYVSEGDKLHFVFAVGDKQSDIEVDITKYIDIYTAGNGLSVDNNKFSIVIEESEGYLTVSEKGLKLEGISDAIYSSVLVEENRAKNREEELSVLIIEEENRANRAELALESTIKNEEERAVSVENNLSNRLSNVENFEIDIKTNKQNIQNLTSNLSTEIVRSTNAENILSNRIDVLTTRVENDEVLTNELNKVLSDEIIARENSVNELYSKDNEIISYINAEIDRAKSAERTNANAISEERNRAISIENKKIEWTDLGNGRKAIVLGNHDLLLGSNADNTKTYNIGMISKWNTVDLGTSSLPINLNTPSGVRPTIQEAGQSGEQAHKIAYLSDFNGYATEEWVNEKGYLNAIPEGYATVDDVTAAVSDKVSETALNEAINGVYSKVSTLITEEFEMLKELVIELQVKVNELEGRMYSSQELIDKIKSMNEGEVLNLRLFNDITFDNEDRLTLPQNSVLNLDMNGKMITANFNDILFRVNGTLNIYGNGQFQGSTYVASVNENGIVNVYDGSFNNEVTSFQANGGIINIEGGKFESYGEIYGAKYTLNHIDAKKNVGLISVKGGTFVNYNPEKSESENPAMNFLAEGYGITVSYTLDNKPVYTVIKQQNVRNSEDLISLISSLDKEKTTYIKLTNDLVFNGDEKVIIDGKLDLRLNGNTIKFGKDDILFRVNGELTIGGGKVVSDGYIASANEGSRITVLDGEYEGSVTCFQSNGGILNIKGGHFSSCNDTYGCKYTLNFIDSKKNIGEIIVEGGTFVGYNPAESESENPVMNFLAEGYKSIEIIEDGLTVYTVIKE